MPLCPRCQQPLPDPPERFCPSCGADVSATPPVPEPAGFQTGVPPGALPPPTGSTPWERRAQLGFVPALFDTTKEVLFSPTALFRAMPVTGGLGSPLVYGLIVGYVGVVANALYGTVFWSMLGTALPGFGRHRELDQLLPYLQGGFNLVRQLVFGPVWVVVMMFILSAVFHLVLLVLGGALRGFEATFRVVSFAQATALFRLLPMCGDFVAPVYFIVVAILGLSEAHRVSRGTAAGAVLLPILLICCCCAAAGIISAFALGGLAGLAGHGR